MPDDDDYRCEKNCKNVVHEDTRSCEDAEGRDGHDRRNCRRQERHARGEGGVEDRQCRLRRRARGGGEQTEGTGECASQLVDIVKQTPTAREIATTQAHSPKHTRVTREGTLDTA